MTEQSDEVRINVPMSPGDLVPRPDPTALTANAVNQAKADLRRELVSQREILESRLDAMDAATKLLDETVHRGPTEVQMQIGHLRELVEARLDGHDNLSLAWREGIEQRFTDTDVRFGQQEAANKEALSTALRAARELSELQTTANALANTKTEQSFSQQLAVLSSTLDSLHGRITSQGLTIVPRQESDAWRAALTDKVDSATGRNADAIQLLQARLDRGEGRDTGAAGLRADSQASLNTRLLGLGVLVSVVVIVVNVAITLIVHH